MATVAREQVIDCIADLRSDFRDGGTPAPDAEAHLAAIILRRLPPEDQQRLSALRAWKEERHLTPAEHAELLSYIERVEREDAERAQALLGLARLREVPLGTLMTDLVLTSGP